MNHRIGKKLLFFTLLIGFLTAAGSATTVIDVSDNSGEDLDNFDLEVDGEGELIERENIDRAELELEEGEYDVEISKRNYRDLDRTIYVDDDEDSTYIFTMTLDDDEFYTIDAEDESGNDLDNLNISVRNNEGTEISRSGINRAQLILEEGDYTITISREGYRTRAEEVSVDGDSDETVLTLSRLEDINIARIENSNAVCSGGSLEVDTVVRNQGSTDQVVGLSASGFGKILQGKSFVIEAGETETYRFVFTNIQGEGEREFRVTLQNYDSSETDNVEVVNCERFGGTGNVENIDMAVYTDSGGKDSFAGEIVRIKGFADGTRGKTTLDLEVNGEEVSEFNTKEDGYFETYYRPTKAGTNTISASASGVSDSEEIRVFPTAEVTSITVPDRVFVGEIFEVCGEIESGIEPEVVLLRDGEVVAEKSGFGTGEVCFDSEESDPGRHTYEVRALTYGTDGSASRQVEVLETGNETTVFPGSITTIETEGRLIRVQLYNTNNEPRNYSLSLEGIQDEWFNSTNEYSYLEKGERENIYFYLSPGRSGSFQPVLEVETDGNIIYSDEVNLESVESKEGVKKGKSLWQLLKNIFFFF